MSYVANNYKTNTDAPENDWVCTRVSSLGPYAEKPPVDKRGYADFCGQCVSYVTRVCTTIPVRTADWKKGRQVRGATDLVAGTAIATFNADGHYYGHAAIYESQTVAGINVWDQWITGKGKPIGPRLIRWAGTGISNDGDGFYVVD
ncbi:BPSL0067 family protein [Sphingomonas sp.]|uniref:BPSL0067 family protein n=1 Tax=Sphingomonas sp. TaxID=28214 RepID=UPI003B006690